MALVSSDYERVTASSLVARLVMRAEQAAEARDLHLDLSLAGGQRGLGSDALDALELAVEALFASAANSAAIGHLALVADYRPDAFFLRLDHDGTFGVRERREAEAAIVATYETLSPLGGSVNFSLGRGFGMRLELTVPYAAQSRNDAPPMVAHEARQLPGNISERNSAPSVERLTPQEEACLSLLAVGYSNKEIASRLHISVGTVKFHLAQIYSKLGVQGRGRGAAVAKARELGLVFD